MYNKFINSLQSYLITREELTIARHIYTFRVRDASFKEILNKYLDLTANEKIAILAEYA